MVTKQGVKLRAIAAELERQAALIRVQADMADGVARVTKVLKRKPAKKAKVKKAAKKRAAKKAVRKVAKKPARKAAKKAAKRDPSQRARYAKSL